MTISSIRKRPEIILLAVIFILISLPVCGQNPIDDIHVTIKSNNKSLHVVLDELTEQTGFYFTFDSRIIDSQRATSIDLHGKPLREVLDTIIQNPGMDYQVINKNIVILQQDMIEIEHPKDSLADSDFITVHGLVSDARNGKGLSYATVAVKDSRFGTITNQNGDFLLRLPDTLQQPILIISYIGYRNYYLPLGIDSDEKIVIEMNKNYISLQEVIIRYHDPISLLSESLLRIDDNFMDEPAGILSYYRERVHKDEKCMVFSEAVVEIDKAAYSSGSTQERTRIIKGRKITNIDLSDTILLKIRSGISTMLELDVVHHLPDFLSDDFILRYNYSFDNVVYYEDNLVYVIRFAQKEGIDETLFRGKIFMDRESLAIIAADFEYDPSRIGREKDMFVRKKSIGLKVRPLGANYHVEYKNSADGYHLNQVHGEVSFKLRKKRQWIASKYTIKLELAVTNIDPGNPPKISLNEKTKPNIVMSDQSFSYDPDFWGEYNTIVPESTLQQALEKIEKSIQEISEKE